MSHKTVWITGASSGIGREFACRYAKLGFRLILTARRRERLDQLAAELLAKYNTFCRVLPADLARESECTRLLLPLAVVLFILIILHPYAPKVLNNVGFAYLTVACIDAETFAANLPRFFFVYIVGSLVFNGVCILLMKPAKALAAKTVKA